MTFRLLFDDCAPYTMVPTIKTKLSTQLASLVSKACPWKEVYEMADDIAAQVMNDKLPRPAIEQEPKEVLPDTSDDVYDRFSALP